MRTRNTLLSLAMASFMGVSAQPLVTLDGTFINSQGQSIPVIVQTVQGTLPMISDTLVADSNGYFVGYYGVTSNTGWFQIGYADCNGTMQYASAQYSINAIGGATISFTLDWCPNTLNCQASFTVQQAMSGGALVPWQITTTNNSTGQAPLVYDWWMPTGASSSQFEPGHTFNAPGVYGICLDITDASGCTSSMCDTILVDSAGFISTGPVWYDCLQILNGPNLPGTPCDDGDPNTINDTWDQNCNCVGYSTSSLLTVTGTIAGCDSNTMVNITDWTTTPVLDTVLLLDPNCGYSITYSPSNPANGWVGLSFSCDGGLTWQTDSAFYSFNGAYTLLIDGFCNGGVIDCEGVLGGSALPGTVCADTSAIGTIYYGIWDPTCTCIPNSILDCLGVPGGTALPGTPCDDGNPATMGDTWDQNCNCVGQGGGQVDCLGVPGGGSLPGTACADTLFGGVLAGIWSNNCICVIDSMVDCTGLIGGPNLPGTSCDDNDPNTINDTWDANCNCTGFNINPCYALFMVAQAQDSTTGPIANTVWVYTNYQQVAGMSVLWDFGDGATSTNLYPQHTYATPGPYLLCLTISGPNCLSTYCDTLQVDPNGIIIPGQGGASGQGFTINVIGNIHTGVDDASAQVTDLTLFPNPTNEVLNIEFGTLATTQVQLEIVDLAGRAVQSEHLRTNGGANKVTLNTAGLENGTYMLRITSNGVITTEPFVKIN